MEDTEAVVVDTEAVAEDTEAAVADTEAAVVADMEVAIPLMMDTIIM